MANLTGTSMSMERVVIKWDGDILPARWNVDIVQEDQEGNERLILSSSRPDFPVNVDDFGPLDEDALIEAIKTLFPGAHINIKF